MTSAPLPPPVIDSARLLAYAYVDDDVHFTDRITLFVNGEPLGAVPRLAICRNYCAPHDILLDFCDENWASKGVVAVSSIEEAKLCAERGYRGLMSKWIPSPYSEEQVDSFLRDVYEVDPRTEWWTTICSFCGNDVHEGAMIVGKTASICAACVRSMYKDLGESDA